MVVVLLDNVQLIHTMTLFQNLKFRRYEFDSAVACVYSIFGTFITSSLPRTFFDFDFSRKAKTVARKLRRNLENVRQAGNNNIKIFYFYQTEEKSFYKKFQVWQSYQNLSELQFLN